MIFTETKLKGAYIIDLQKLEDIRGFFARSWCQREFSEHGLNDRLVQCDISFNHKRGTLRGMHYQQSPYAEAKLVRCAAGALYDVIVDLRPDSPTYLQWISVQLSAQNRRAVFVPEGFAHGFQTLLDDTEVLYQMSEFYTPEAAGGFRWDDPLIKIRWPGKVSVISPKDQSYPDFKPVFQRMRS